VAEDNSIMSLLGTNNSQKFDESAVGWEFDILILSTVGIKLYYVLESE
jgi:hypothetical protein